MIFDLKYESSEKNVLQDTEAALTEVVYLIIIGGKLQIISNMHAPFLTKIVFLK